MGLKTLKPGYLYQLETEYYHIISECINDDGKYYDMKDLMILSGLTNLEIWKLSKQDFTDTIVKELGKSEDLPEYKL